MAFEGKHDVVLFKSLAVALKELEPFVRDGRQLQVGGPFAKFGGLRPREVWGNWLMCAVWNARHDYERFAFATDPTGGDGLILDRSDDYVFQTEHVFVPGPHPGKSGSTATYDVKSLILEKIKHKSDPKYGGKTLIVFCNDGGNGVPWYPTRVAKALPQEHPFAIIWVVCFEGIEADWYVYNVACLELMGPHRYAPVWRLSTDFETWTVSLMQWSAISGTMPNK